MRRIIVSMNVTLDGFMSGPDCGLDWHFNSWTPEMGQSLCEQLTGADTILLGRITYSAMAGYWPGKAGDTDFPREDIAIADMMNSYRKIVISKTLTTTSWNNSSIMKGNARKEIIRLKQSSGKDIIIYGSGILVSALMQSGLIDEYVLWIHPVILGRGHLLFRKPHDQLDLELIKTKTFSSGVVVLYYETSGKPLHCKN